MQVEGRVFELESAGLKLGEIEDIVEHGEQAARRLLQGLGIAPLHAVERACQQQLRHGDDRAHRGAELVAYLRVRPEIFRLHVSGPFCFPKGRHFRRNHLKTG